VSRRVFAWSHGGASQLAGRRYKRTFGTDRAWLALLALLPWALLMAGGGIHNHGLPVTGNETARERPALPEAPGFRQEATGGADGPCLACLWQMQSLAAAGPRSSMSAGRIVPFRVLATEDCPRSGKTLSFDSRAPPLS